MKLIIVESPTKARTLTKFLGGDYRVEATMGHIRDLPKGELGVDVEHDFEPSYVTMRDKMKRVKELKDLAAKSDGVMLATDPDREGEAIAWHIAALLKKKEKGKKKTFDRITFHEITESAIKNALTKPSEIDMNMVNAQQARRILDRLVGYKLSPLLWQKLSRRWLSAGRVQSVAVRLIVEREREIEKFEKIEYWTIDGVFDGTIQASLVSKNGEKYEQKLTFDLFDGQYSTAKTTIPNEAAALSVIADMQAPYTVSAVDKKEIRRSSPAPYTTSTLQQDASRRLYYSAKRTMQVAQKLYEEGLITYHRTDSVNLSDKFITEAREYIQKQYGKEYIPSSPKTYQTKSKVAQEAHEAIRPTDPALTSAVRPELNRDHERLYELIWSRAMASQASDAVFDSTSITITSANAYQFSTQGSVIKFDGYLRIIGRDTDENVIPSVSVGQNVTRSGVTPVGHVTSPPPRYSEATLIKTLEEKDIGRPSTYAPTISTIIERTYVVKEEKKLVPTELGMAVTDFLVLYFPKILSLPFTANMENELDRVAGGKKEWVPVIREFYEPFVEALENSYKTAVKVKMAEEVLDEACPKCTSPLVIRTGKFGKFVACTTFPKCDYTRQLAEKIDIKCPRCQGDMVVKKSRRGKVFYGCGNYPTCTFAAWKKEDIK